MEIPLFVCARVNVPHPLVDPEQVAVQSTPSLTAFITVLVMLAVNCAIALVVRLGGGAGGLNPIATLPPGATATVPEAIFVMSEVEVAVIVTEPPLGTVGGALYVVLTPLAVCVGAKKPQSVPAQVAVQSTPKFEESPATFAESMKLLPAFTVPGSAAPKLTEIPDPIFTLPEANFVMSE